MNRIVMSDKAHLSLLNAITSNKEDIKQNDHNNKTANYEADAAHTYFQSIQTLARSIRRAGKREAFR